MNKFIQPLTKNEINIYINNINAVIDDRIKKYNAMTNIHTLILIMSVILFISVLVNSFYGNIDNYYIFNAMNILVSSIVVYLIINSRSIGNWSMKNYIIDSTTFIKNNNLNLFKMIDYKSELYYGDIIKKHIKSINEFYNNSEKMVLVYTIPVIMQITLMLIELFFNFDSNYSISLMSLLYMLIFILCTHLQISNCNNRAFVTYGEENFKLIKSLYLNDV